MQGLHDERPACLHECRHRTEQSFDRFFSQQGKIAHHDIGAGLKFASGNFLIGNYMEIAAPKAFSLVDQLPNSVHSIYVYRVRAEFTG